MKKKIVNSDKLIANLQKQITKQQHLLNSMSDMLEEHESRIREFKTDIGRKSSVSSQRISAVTHVKQAKPQPHRRPVVHSISESESEQSSKSDEDGSISSGDYEDMYKTLNTDNKRDKRKKR
jgi:hypothetical protein